MGRGALVVASFASLAISMQYHGDVAQFDGPKARPKRSQGYRQSCVTCMALTETPYLSEHLWRGQSGTMIRPSLSLQQTMSWVHLQISPL